jgi:YebC/PmpR family DNA-binding regulatory protein
VAGHSKWKNIQHRKGAQDAKRGKIFTKIATEITVAARLAGGDPDTNPRLRTALLKARSANMPKDNVERAVKKGLGNLEGVSYSEKVYEGYGPGGIAFVVECLTDNVNRTVGEVRTAFNRAGGNMGTEGSVAWQFQTKGMFAFEKTKLKNYDQLFETAIEHGADDVEDAGEVYEVTCGVEHFQALRDAFEKSGIAPDMAEIARIPENSTKVDGKQAESIQKLVDMLEDNDDVQNVYHNAEIPD